MPVAIICFLATIAGTLLITALAARSVTGKAGYYAAGGNISGVQNGWAIAGDFMSATTFLGLTGLYFASGLDVSLFYLTPLAGFCLMLLLIVGPLRRLGRYTLGEVIEARLRAAQLRVFSGVSTIIISVIYLVAQLVGAGSLISLLFGLPFEAAVAVIGALMTAYVVFGGMLAATWVQIIKALLLTSAAVALGVLSILNLGSLAEIYERAAEVHELGERLFATGGQEMGLFSSVSLCVGLVLGMAGMPHLLIRFFTVPDETQARRSLTTASLIVGGVFGIMFLVVAPAAVALVTGDPRFTAPDGGPLGGTNMVVVHLARALGGELLFGILAAVAFATILAVVSGLTTAVSSAAANDIYAVLGGKRRSERNEIHVFRAAAVLSSLLVVLLAIAFKHENVAFLSTMAFSVAASANFPVLILALYWRGTTAAGAMVGGLVGLGSSMLMIVLGPGVWVKVLGYAEPIVPSEFPALLTAPLAAGATILVSLFPASPQAAAHSAE